MRQLNPTQSTSYSFFSEIQKQNWQPYDSTVSAHSTTEVPSLDGVIELPSPIKKSISVISKCIPPSRIPNTSGAESRTKWRQVISALIDRHTSDDCQSKISILTKLSRSYLDWKRVLGPEWGYFLRRLSENVKEVNCNDWLARIMFLIFLSYSHHGPGSFGHKIEKPRNHLIHWQVRISCIFNRCRWRWWCRRLSGHSQNYYQFDFLANCIEDSKLCQ